MVTINLTLVIEVGLFLIFLWGTARFILRPVLRTLDERDAVIEQDQAQAAVDMEEANTLEGQSARKLLDIRQRTDEAHRDARHETRKGHVEAVARANESADQAVAEAHDEAIRLVAGQRNALEKAVPEVADLIAERLRSVGPTP